MKRVLTYGTFDLLHYGHVEYLRKAKMMGDYLVVGVCTDAFNEKKGKQAYYNYEIRKKMVEAIRYVDLVIPQESFEQKKLDIEKYEISILVSSDDWLGKYDYLKEFAEVKYLNREPEISTTKLKNDVKIYKESNKQE